MKRVVWTTIGLGIVVLLVLIPAAMFGYSDGGEETYEPTRITRYLADFDVAADGEMTVTETLTVDFPIGGRHGIFRFWDVVDPNATTLRREPRDVSVALDGQPEDFSMSTEDNGRYHVAKIGSEFRTLDVGEHTYVLRYTIDDALVETDGDGSQFYWNLIPGGWQQQIDQARLTVTLPAEAGDVECAVGVGETGGCTADGEGGTELVVKVQDLDARTPVTVRTQLDLPVPEVQGPSRPWPARFDPVLGGNVAVAVLTLLLAVGALAWAACSVPARGSRSRRTR